MKPQSRQSGASRAPARASPPTRGREPRSVPRRGRRRRGVLARTRRPIRLQAGASRAVRICPRARASQPRVLKRVRFVGAAGVVGMPGSLPNPRGSFESLCRAGPVFPAPLELRKVAPAWERRILLLAATSSLHLPPCCLSFKLASVERRARTELAQQTKLISKCDGESTGGIMLA